MLLHTSATGCEAGWRGVSLRSSHSLPRQVSPRPLQDVATTVIRRASLSARAVMPSSSREKSPRVSKVFAKISSDSKSSRHHGEPKVDDTQAPDSTTESPEGKAPKSPKLKKSKRSILPYFRGHKSGKKSEKEKEKLIKKDKLDESNESDVLSQTVREKEDSQCVLEVNLPELVTKETDVLPSKELVESGNVDCNTSDVTNEPLNKDSEPLLVSDKCDEYEDSEKNDGIGLVDFKTYSLVHSTRLQKYQSPLKKTQPYQKSFLHNSYGSTSTDTLPGCPNADHPGLAPLSGDSFAFRCRTLDHTSSPGILGRHALSSQAKSSTLDTVRARFQNHVNNLTYEGMEFNSSDQSSCSSSTWSLGGRSFSSPFSKFSSHTLDSLKGKSKDKDKKASKGVPFGESKSVAKSGVKKLLLHNRNKENMDLDLSPDRNSASPEVETVPAKADPVESNVDSITIISNKNVRAKLNITVVKTPEVVRRSSRGSFRFSRNGARSSIRASQRKKKEASSPPPGASAPPSLTISASTPTLPSVKKIATKLEGKPIPEYAKVNKRKNSKPDIVEEDEFNILASSSHIHESPAEKAPVVKKIEAAAYKARKDCDPSLKVNPVKKTESFKTGSRVGRRSSLTFASRAKMMKENMEHDSFVKSQAIKLRRKDSKNGRFDPKNARKAEYRLSVTIKPSTVATLTNKFNTIISQNQAESPLVKSELPVGHVSVHKTRVLRSPRASIRLKARQKLGKSDAEGKDNKTIKDQVMDEKSKKEEKNREEKRGDLAVHNGKRGNSKASRSPSPKKLAGPKANSSLLAKLGDNKTDEEKVCEKIKTALSSAKFKGETDDSEDDFVDKNSAEGGRTNDRTTQNSSSLSELEAAESASHASDEVTTVPVPNTSAPCSSSSLIPKTPDYPERDNDPATSVLAQHSKSGIGKANQEFSLPERHAKSDSMDSGISTEGDPLSRMASPSLPSTSDAASSDPYFLASTVDDSSLETVASTDTCRSEDSGIALKTTGDSASQEVASGLNNADNAEYQQKKLSNFLRLKEKCSSSTLMSGQKHKTDNENCNEDITDALNCDDKANVCTDPEVKATSNLMNLVEGIISDDLESEEKGTIDVLESESKNESKTLESEASSFEDILECQSIDADSRSIGSSNMDDTRSEVSSVCSDAKTKKSGKGHESRIYTAVKTAVKNTVKKTKEKDAERKEERDRERRNRSPSADREKWYRRGRSRERGRNKKKDEKDEELCDEGGAVGGDSNNDDDKCDSPKKDCKERESRTYERFTLKRLREKSQERRRNKEKVKEELQKEEERKKDEDKDTSLEDFKKESKNKKKEDKGKEDGTYGKWTLRSRSRSRDRKKNKDRYLEQLAQEEAEDLKEQEEVTSSQDAILTVESQPEILNCSQTKTLPNEMRKKEDLVFTFDTESLYDRPQTPKNFAHAMKSKTLPPPPKTPIPSPPSSATIPLPPPPKTPIPDVPTEAKRDCTSDSKDDVDLILNSSDRSNGDSDSSNDTENIYENLYAPNLQKLHRNREKLESRGIRPNSSFLWSDGAQAPANIEVADQNQPPCIEEETEPERSPFKRMAGVRNYGRYGKISPSSKSRDEGAEGHNYAELQQSSEDSQTLAYDDIGAVSAISYDDIGAPSSCGYDDIQAPSTVGYDTIKPPSEGYDPVNPPRSDSSQYDDCDGGIVTAQFAVVREDQLDSISYMYDEISMYNASQNSHSYEPVNPPGVSPQIRPAISSIEELPEAETPTAEGPNNVADYFHDESEDEDSESNQGDSSDGVHEVFSYKLTRIGGNLDAIPPPVQTPTTPTTPSTPGSACHRLYGAPVPPLSLVNSECLVGGESAPSPSLSPTEGKSETSDEWMDVSDTETDTSTGPPVTITTQIPLVRIRQRSKRWRPRNWRRSWSQGVRSVAAHAHTIAHAYASSPVTRDDEIEYSWREGGDSEEDDNATSHYEAIYEVINPAEDENLQPTTDDQEFDDSFDSDDSDDAYCRLRPQFRDDSSQTSRDHPESLSSEVSSSEKSQVQVQQVLHTQQQQQQQHLDQQQQHHHHQQQQQQQQYGITKIAEAANIGMRRLRRNWSMTKNEVRTGLNRIKKKSTFSASDMKSTENLACDASPSSADAAEKRKWSFKSHFRRKSSAGSLTTVVSRTTGVPSKKESATFYLTLTIETGRQETGELPIVPPRTMRSESESVLSGLNQIEHRRLSTPSVSSVNTTHSGDSAVTFRQRPTRKGSPGSSICAPVRPRTAPPAPPPKDKDVDVAASVCEDEELSKSSVASRLNQLLSTGPIAPPGRRVLRTSECSSSDSSPVPVLIHPEDGVYTGIRPSSIKYATLHMNNNSVVNTGASEDSSGDEKPLGSEVTNSVMLNVPQTRTSVVSAASHGSSEGYIRPGDIASAPPPLPARQTPSTSLSNLKSSSSHGSQSVLLHMPSSLMDGDNSSYLDFSCDALNHEEPLYVSSHFADEPLYQFYTATVLERAAQNQGDCSSEDDYEVINDGHGAGAGKLQSRPSAMELVTPADGRRTLWCELPEVMDSGLLSQINSQERKTQEAMFEMITSEASYLKSLNVLVTHFVQCPEFTVDEGEDAILSRRERHILFSDILPVKRCSEMFLADLEKRWQESVRISTIADIIIKHADNHYQAYVKYCSNQIYQDRILKELKENNPRFLEVLNRQETSPVCQSLAMHSFLMLPMQRITRLPLLVDAIFHRLDYGTPDWNDCKLALATLTKIVAACNEGARKMERMEEMLIISRQLDFREVKAIPLISASRWLVKKGELTRLTWRENDAKLTFGRRISKHTLYFFLFTDLLVVTKKKSEDQYMVLDYCSRNMVQVLELDATDKFPGRILDGHKNLLIITMLQNHDNKTVEMVVSCPLESDRTRWVEAVTPRTSDNPDERIYEEWDCPQVQAMHPYVGKQPDELSLEVSDVVNVLKKTPDGWYQGERIRDQERGWFPGSFTVEISSTHVRARNLRQRYRLLAISSSLLDELKREKERYEKEEKKKDRRRTLTMKEVISSQAQAL